MVNQPHSCASASARAPLSPTPCANVCA